MRMIVSESLYLRAGPAIIGTPASDFEFKRMLSEQSLNKVDHFVFEWVT